MNTNTNVHSYLKLVRLIWVNLLRLPLGYMLSLSREKTLLGAPNSLQHKQDSAGILGTTQLYFRICNVYSGILSATRSIYCIPFSYWLSEVMWLVHKLVYGPAHAFMGQQNFKWKQIKFCLLLWSFLSQQKSFNDSKAYNITNMNNFEWSIYRTIDQSIWTEAHLLSCSSRLSK